MRAAQLQFTLCRHGTQVAAEDRKRTGWARLKNSENYILFRVSKIKKVRQNNKRVMSSFRCHAGCPRAFITIKELIHYLSVSQCCMLQKYIGLVHSWFEWSNLIGPHEVINPRRACAARSVCLFVCPSVRPSVTR